MVPEVVNADWVRRRQFTIHSLEVMNPWRARERALGERVEGVASIDEGREVADRSERRGIRRRRAAIARSRTARGRRDRCSRRDRARDRRVRGPFAVVDVRNRRR